MFENFDLITTSARLAGGIILGLIVALIYMYKNSYNKSFVITLVLLPAIVGTVISIVNGNVGTGIAVMGAFSLVRFRSIPGTAKEIVFIFFAMAVGLATGMGYIAYAVAFTFIVGLTSLILFMSPFGNDKRCTKLLKITLPENLDYSELFEDVFSEFTAAATLKNVKTTNMGSLFKLTYEIELKKDASEKDFIDKLRCRNGNLEIICGYLSDSSEVL